MMVYFEIAVVHHIETKAFELHFVANLDNHLQHHCRLDSVDHSWNLVAVVVAEMVEDNFFVVHLMGMVLQYCR